MKSAYFLIRIALDKRIDASMLIKHKWIIKITKSSKKCRWALKRLLSSILKLINILRQHKWATVFILPFYSYYKCVLMLSQNFIALKIISKTYFRDHLGLSAAFLNFDQRNIYNVTGNIIQSSMPMLQI